MENMGPFKLEAVLGRGGMGTVYRATNTESNEQVALKVLSPAYSADEHFRNRFESEIKALLKLDHPNIVRLVSYGQFEHNLYFAMELVEGKSLFQMQRDGAVFHWREVLRIAKNVALGLRHAHDRGVIHRDLKPGNLLKAYTGIIKITDFGIAKSYGISQDTGTNVLGTVDFMSPEQAKGQPATFRSDLYSLGAVMYTLLGGRPPFTSNSFEESIRNLTRVPAPRISRIAPEVPKVIDELISQLLEKAPENRVSTALSLYHHLRQAEQELRDSSEALTAEIPSVGTSEQTHIIGGPKTSVDEDRGKAHTIPHDIDSNADVEIPSGETRNDGAAGNPSGPALIKAEQDGKDFFTNVTDTERQVHLDITEEEHTPTSAVGKIVLAAMLIVVLLLAGYGIYQANQVPSADNLMSQIRQEWNQPQKRMAAITLFLANYPEHEDIELVQGREKLARAYHKLIELRRRSRQTGGISETEKSFLSIIDSGTEDLPGKSKRLQAFVSLYEKAPDPQQSTLECLEAARAFLTPLKSDARRQKQKVRDNIENQLNRAKTLAPTEAIELYESVIQLNSKFEWVSDLIEIAQQQIEKIKLGGSHK